MDGLSDRGSIPLSSTQNGKNSRNAEERVPAVFICIFQHFLLFFIKIGFRHIIVI